MCVLWCLGSFVGGVALARVYWNQAISEGKKLAAKIEGLESRLMAAIKSKL